MDEDTVTIEAAEYFRDWREDLIARLRTDSPEDLAEELAGPGMLEQGTRIIGLVEHLADLQAEAEGELPEDQVTTAQAAEYQAARAYDRAYRAAMADTHAPGRASEREDFAQSNGAAAYAARLREYGYDPADCPEPHGP